MEINNYVSWASHFKKQDLDHLVCLALELPGLWVEAWSWFPNGGLWEGSCLLMFHGVRSSLVVQSPKLGYPTSGSGPSPYCSTKISQATQHRKQNPKTNGETTVSSQEHPKRHTLAKRREKEKIKEVKKEESNQANNQAPKWKWILKIRL